MFQKIKKKQRDNVQKKILTKIKKQYTKQELRKSLIRREKCLRIAAHLSNTLETCEEPIYMMAKEDLKRRLSDGWLILN